MDRILIVEDEEAIAELEKDYLELSGFAVEVENDGISGLNRALKEEFNLVILDLMLPGIDGFEICRKIREGKNTPIIMVSAKKDDIDKIRGLGLGADDYMTKPFGVMEMLSRVKALLRRAKMGGVQEATEQVIRPALRFHEITLDEAKHRVSVQEGGEELHPELTLKEFELLSYMMHNQELVLTRDQIMGQVWNYDYEGESRTIDMHVKTLRQKLGEAGQYIKTVRGVGYRLSAD